MLSLGIHPPAWRAGRPEGTRAPSPPLPRAAALLNSHHNAGRQLIEELGGGPLEVVVILGLDGNLHLILWIIVDGVRTKEDIGEGAQQSVQMRGDNPFAFPQEDAPQIEGGVVAA